MRHNHIHHGRDVGIFTFDNGRVGGGWVELCEVGDGWSWVGWIKFGRVWWGGEGVSGKDRVGWGG